MKAALKLALSIRERYPYTARDPMTHLKLQKLAFYCYGLASAFQLDDEIGEMTFAPWGHGPVNREIWNAYKQYKALEIEAPSTRMIVYSHELGTLLDDVIAIYGVLDAWKIRQQSHLEAPWRKAFDNHAETIANETIEEHFKQKYRSGPVRLPEYVLDGGSFALDGVHVVAHDSLADAAATVRRMIAA